MNRPAYETVFPRLTFSGSSSVFQDTRARPIYARPSRYKVSQAACFQGVGSEHNRPFRRAVVTATTDVAPTLCWVSDKTLAAASPLHEEASGFRGHVEAILGELRANRLPLLDTRLLAAAKHASDRSLEVGPHAKAGWVERVAGDLAAISDR